MTNSFHCLGCHFKEKHRNKMHKNLKVGGIVSYSNPEVGLHLTLHKQHKIEIHYNTCILFVTFTMLQLQQPEQGLLEASLPRDAWVIFIKVGQFISLSLLAKWFMTLRVSHASLYF